MYAIRSYYGSALGDTENQSVRSTNLALCALMDRIEGLEVEDLIIVQPILVLQAPQYRHVDRIAVLLARRLV